MGILAGDSPNCRMAEWSIQGGSRTSVHNGTELDVRGLKMSSLGLHAILTLGQCK